MWRVRALIRGAAECAAVAAVLALLLPSRVLATSPEGTDQARELMHAMKRAFEPARSSIREIQIVTKTPQGNETIWSGKELRTVEPDGRAATLLVLLAPDSVRGFAVLTRQSNGDTPQMWMYAPPVKRVRRLVYAGKLQPFLGTDLTYEDVGLVDLTERAFRRIGTEVIDGRRVVKIESKPADATVYARIVTFLEEGSAFPVRREYYDRAGELWRVATYEAADLPDGKGRTIASLTVEDVQEGYATTLRYRNPRYDVVLPAQLFEPAGLPAATAHPLVTGR